MESLLAWLSQWGYAGLFSLLVFGIVGLPIPDETLLVFSGYLVSQGRLHPLLTFLTAFAGAVCGISTSYVIGRTAGHAVVERFGHYVRLTPARLADVNQWFDRIGNWLLTVGYFIPGVRHFTALVAGMSGVQFRTFALYAYPGAAVWVGVFLIIGRIVGKNWEAALEAVHHYTWYFIGAAGLLLLIAFLIHRWVVNRNRYNPK
jgi:membrane protein DedA with SNARE-associated domain